MNISFNKNQYWLTPITTHTATFDVKRPDWFILQNINKSVPSLWNRERNIRSVCLSKCSFVLFWLWVWNLLCIRYVLMNLSWTDWLKWHDQDMNTHSDTHTHTHIQACVQHINMHTHTHTHATCHKHLKSELRNSQFNKVKVSMVKAWYVCVCLFLCVLLVNEQATD